MYRNTWNFYLNSIFSSTVLKCHSKTENVCVGTNAKDNKKHYLTRPASAGNFHGQAAVLWAATAMVRLQK